MKEWLFAPGPLRIPDRIKHALTEDPPYFAGPRFSALLEEIQPKLRTVFSTSNTVLIGTGSGSMGMDACVTNFTCPGNLVLVLVNGKYGHNWSQMCSHYGCEVMDLFSPKPGKLVNRNVLERCLKSEGHKIKCVYMQHVETTTGIVNPINEYAELIRANSDALIIVDAVCSLLTEYLHSDHFDVVISASQKGLQLPPGLFFVMVTPRALRRTQTSCGKQSFYFNILQEIERSKHNITTFTPAATLINALNVALDAVLEIGVDKLIFKTQNNAMACRSSIQRLGYSMLTNYPCNAVTAFDNNQDFNLWKKLYDRNIVVGNGLRELKDKILRVAHMGWDFNPIHLQYLYDAIKNLREVEEPYP